MTRLFDFTVAEDSMHLQDNSCKIAFTLAEVLITIGIIGVVSAMTLPMLKANIEERVNTERQVNIVQKITKAMEVMKSHGELYDFNSTEEFVDALKKYIKVVKICDSEHLEECWPTETVRNADNEVYEVKNAKTRNNLGFLDNKTVENVGLVLADGASLIMTYNPSNQNSSQYEVSKTINKSLPVGEGKTKDYAYTTDVTSGIAFVMDVNGKGAPNKETIAGKYYDIRSFNGAHFGTPDETSCGSGEKVEGYCVLEIDSYISLSCASDDFKEYCGKLSGYTDDYWAGANYACKKKGMELSSSAVLQKLYLANWDNKPTAGIYWSSDQVSNSNGNVSVFSFKDGTIESSTGTNRQTTKNKNNKVLCVGSYK